MNDARAIAKRKPLMSRIPAGFVQAVLRGHSGLGLAFAAAIYVVCLSGSLLVFHDELIWWEASGAPELEQVSADTVQTAIDGAIRLGGPGVEHVYVTLPAEDNPLLRIYVDGEEDSNWVADGDGRITGRLDAPFSQFLSELHIYLHLPKTWGIFVVGMTGVALLSSLISGILAHPRIFRDAFYLRLGGSRRLQEADLHNRIGVWGLPFHFIVSLSGAFLGMVTITVGVLGMAMFDGDTGKVYGMFFPAEPVDNPASAPVIDIRPMFEQSPAKGRLERIFIEHPTEQGAAVMFDYRNDDVLAGDESHAYDRSGKAYYTKRIQESSLGERVLGSLGPLHFGWFGGAPIKIAYFLLGLGMTYLAVGGVDIWLARRRDKGRPAPRWERIWAATVWSQPVGLAAAAMLALIIPTMEFTRLTALWLVITGLFLLASFVLNATIFARCGKAMTAILLLAMAGWHACFLAAGSGRAMPWVVDLALLTGAAILLWAGWQSKPSKPSSA